MKKIKKLLCIMLAAFLLASVGTVVAGAEEPVQPDMEALQQKFIAYLDKQGVTHEFGGGDSSGIKFITKANDWTVFYGTPGWSGDMFTNDWIGGYVFVSQSWETPYKIGLYAEKDGKVLTLQEAYNTGEIDIMRVVDNVGAASMSVYLSGDINKDGEITVSDVIEVQKAIAKYLDVSQEEFSFPFYDFDGNGEVSIKDALDMQKRIAKVTD